MSWGTQRLEWRHGLLFEGEDAREFRFPISGDPAEVGAKPSDLLPLALASCLAYDVVVVLGKKRQDLAGLTVTIVSEQQDLAPLRFTRITLRFEARGRVEETAAARALELAEKNCPVLASIDPAVEIVSSIKVVA
ncbi:MAG: OsmC family protein [Acidimicrobiales bacterium]